MSIHGVIRRLDDINIKATHLVKWLVPVLILILVYEVFMRYVIGNPTLWVFDMAYMTCSLFLAIGMGYTLQVGGQVNIDIIIDSLPPRTRSILQAVFYVVLFFPLWGLITYFFLFYVVDSWESLDRARVGTWMPPIYPFNTWLWIGSLLLFLQGISEFLKLIYLAITGKETYEDPEKPEQTEETTSDNANDHEALGEAPSDA